MFLDHNGIKLEIRNRSMEKSPNIWKLINVPLNNLTIKEDLKKENRKHF